MLYAWLMPHCPEPELIIQGSIFITLLLAGFFGGFTHCVGMCSPFVISQVTARSAMVSVDKMTRLTRLSGAALIPYHLGRITTYMLLGGVGASVVYVVKDADWFRYLATFLLSLAGILFIFAGVKSFIRTIPLIDRISSVNSRFINKLIPTKLVKKLSLDPRGIKGYLLGFFLGFLPCGLIYASLAAAISASGGDVIVGMLAMGAFAIGTVPALIVVGLGSDFLFGKWQKHLKYLARGVMVFSGISLIVMSYGFL